MLIASYYPQYNATIAKANTLLVKYNNITLNASIHVLETEFAAIQKSGVNQSIGVANTILMFAHSQLYPHILKRERIILAGVRHSAEQHRLDNGGPAELPAGAIEACGTGRPPAGHKRRAQLEGELQRHRFNNTRCAEYKARIRGVRSAAHNRVHDGETLDGPFITAILGGSSATPPERIASAPIYATLASLIVGILVVLVIFVITYFQGDEEGQAEGRQGARPQRQWGITFAVLIILVAIYAYATYAYASNANSNFLPFNYFLNTLKSSPTAYIALNGSAANNLSIGSCVTTVQKYLASAGKSVQVVKLTNYSCVSGSNISILGLNCYDNILNSAKPVVLITQSKEGSIVYKGLYGTVLYANGNIASGSSCVLGSLLKSV